MIPCELPCWCCGGPDGYDAELRLEGTSVIVFTCLECAAAANALILF